MRTRVAFLTATAATGLGVAACEESTGVDVGAVPEWTIMAYIAGDNDITPDGILAIDRLEAAGVDPRINVVVQAEFSPIHLPPPDECAAKDASCFNRPNFNTFRYVITGEGESVPGPDGTTIDIGNRNMTDPAELRAFIEWARTNFPARRTLLTLWNHGGGYTGLLMDSTSAGRDYMMSLTDLSRALEGLTIDVLGFDMCLMAGYETLAKTAGNASFVVFSQEVTYLSYPYKDILEALQANPAAGGETVAKIMADEIAAWDADTLSSESTTVSAYDLSGFGSFESALDTLATSLRSRLPTLAPAIRTAVDRTEQFDTLMKDIVNFVDSLDVRVTDAGIEAQIARVRDQALNPEFRLRSHFNNGSDADQPDVSRSAGLSIVLPSVIGRDTFATSGPRSLAAYQDHFPGRPWTLFLTDFVEGQATGAVASRPPPIRPIRPQCR